MTKKKEPFRQLIAQNRRARHDYNIESTFEAGLVLMGSEVKSLRGTGASIKEAYAGEEDEEIILYNSHIAEYAGARRLSHDPKGRRKLLLHRKEINKLVHALRQKGATLVPLSLYFNKKGIAKIEIGLARGRKKADVRRAAKERDWKREQVRILREK
jgi:SsrA-binding protein